MVPNTRHKVFFLILSLCATMMYFQQNIYIGAVAYPIIFVPILFVLFHCKEDPLKVSLRKYRKKVYLEKIFVISSLLIAASYLCLIILKNRVAITQSLILDESPKLDTLPFVESQKIVFLLILVLVLGYFHFRKEVHDD